MKEKTRKPFTLTKRPQAVRFRFPGPVPRGKVAVHNAKRLLSRGAKLWLADKPLNDPGYSLCPCRVFDLGRHYREKDALEREAERLKKARSKSKRG